MLLKSRQATSSTVCSKRARDRLQRPDQKGVCSLGLWKAYLSASLSWLQGLDSWLWGWGRERNHEDLASLWPVDQSIAFSTWINMVLPSGRSQLLAGAKTRLLLLFPSGLGLGITKETPQWSLEHPQNPIRPIFHNRVQHLSGSMRFALVTNSVTPGHARTKCCYVHSTG